MTAPPPRQCDTPPWYLYVLRCADGTLYTGITKNLKRRVAEHTAGHGARYTQPRRPVTVIAAWRYDEDGHARALRAEQRFKRLRRQKKLSVVAGQGDWEGGARVDDMDMNSGLRPAVSP